MSIKSEALKDVNSIRMALGANPLPRLRKGYTGKEKSCPLANSLKDLLPNVNMGMTWVRNVDSRVAGKVAQAIYTSVDYDNDIFTSDRLRTFIGAFDDEKFPELVKK